MSDVPIEAIDSSPLKAAVGLTRRAFVKGALVVVGTAAGLTVLRPSRSEAQAEGARDMQKPTIYLIATAHNDTQWNWTVQHTIQHCIPNTMRPNWELFEKYPAYNFNYEGVIHYMFFKEYHPDDWPELQRWVAQGRWKLSGSWINAVDVNVPSPESLFRQALYGQQFFRREFGRVSRDIYLPDCFGFPYSLPTIGRHSGLNAFSTQKFDLWGGWRPTPFDVGRWRGVDGSELVAALKPGSYGTQVRADVATDPGWNDDFSPAGDRPVDFRYFGTGDQGGTPDEESVQWVQRSVDDTTGHARVVNTSADQMAQDLTPAEVAALTVYDGELTMTRHGVGGYTSQAAHKKWNRMNEQMADAAERAALAGAWLGGPAYPHETLSAVWVRTLWHQFHDTLPGTCIPHAYTFVWNDDLLNLNQSSQIVTTGVGAMARHLDTQAVGVPLVVYNPLDQPRTDAVEALVTLPGAAPTVRVFDGVTGTEVPSQVLSRDGVKIKIVFIAHTPAVGCRVYDVRPSPRPCALKTGLHVTSGGLESARYRVTVNEAGDIAGVYDKSAKTELLRTPSQLQHFHDYSPNWPAWEILWDTVRNPPQGVIHENARVRVTEHGPARVALEVTRTLGESTFIQHIRLTSGGDWVTVHNDVDWQTPGTLVKAAFPMTASRPMATYDLGLGTIERPNAAPERYEVNAQQWADVTDVGGGHGLAILTDYKYGWDKPDDRTLRLSLIRTPDGGENYPWQNTNDLGRHRFDYALAGHAGDWRTGNVPQQAARFNQPLCAFQTAAHAGTGGREFGLLHVGTPQVGVRALKKAEDSDEWVVRVQELHGVPVRRAAITFAAPVVSVREINAAEEQIGPFPVQAGRLVMDLTAYQPRSFAVRLAPAPHKIASPVGVPLALPYDLDGVSRHADLTDGAFDKAGGSYPGELWPAHLTSDGIEFILGSSAPGVKNMVECRGQTILLPPGDHDSLSLLAASVGGDRSGVFTVHAGKRRVMRHTLQVQDWQALTGQWYSRLIHNDPADPAHFGPGTGYPDPEWNGGLVLANMAVKKVHGGRAQDLGAMQTAFIKRDAVAWVGTHRHTPAGDLPYCLCYLFRYRLPLPAGAVSVTLPDAPSIRIMAMTAARNELNDTFPAGVLYEPDPYPKITPRTLAPPFPVVVRLPPGSVVFPPTTLLSFDGAQEGLVQEDVPGLPTRASDPWTINQFVRLDKTPAELTVLGGFGDGSDTGGTQRYLIKFHDGLHFWGSDVDVTTGVPFDVGRWQMITLTFDGATLTIYKNGRVLTTAPISLQDAENVVRIGASGPWNGNRLAGRIAGFTIWNSALDSPAVQALMTQMPKKTP